MGSPSWTDWNRIIMWWCRMSRGPTKVVLVVKNPPANAGDTRNTGSIPGSGRSPGEGNGNPLQYSCLENSMDRGAKWATVHWVARVRHDLANTWYINYTYASSKKTSWKFSQIKLRFSLVSERQSSRSLFQKVPSLSTSRYSCNDKLTDVYVTTQSLIFPTHVRMIMKTIAPALSESLCEDVVKV